MSIRCDNVIGNCLEQMSFWGPAPKNRKKPADTLDPDVVPYVRLSTVARPGAHLDHY
jgi:hypothetical protein